METYVPNERIVRRGARWWAAAIVDPKFDNLGDSGSPSERFTRTMGGAMASRLHTPPAESQSAAFVEELTKALLTEETRGSYSRYPDTLMVDYGPEPVLENAARSAGLKVQFPWKTYMRFAWDGKSLSVTHGYGAPTIHHYPLSQDRWLVAAMSGDDIARIIEFCEAGGVIPGLRIVGDDDLCI